MEEIQNVRKEVKKKILTQPDWFKMSLCYKLYVFYVDNTVCSLIKLNATVTF
jgi:hypothetical protein